MANEYEEFYKAHVEGWGKIPLAKSGGIRTFKFIKAVPRDVPGIDAALPIRIEIITARKATKELTYGLDYIKKSATWYIPESKYINTPNHVIRSVAFPQRQYSKVVTANNIYFANATGIAVDMTELSPVLKVGVLDIMDNYDKPYPSYNTALGMVTSGEVYARAFSRRFLVRLEKTSRYPLIVYKNGVVGYDDGSTIIMPAHMENLAEIVKSVTRRGVVLQ